MSKIEFYQKKPIALAAVQYTGSKSCRRCIDFLNKQQRVVAYCEDHALINTLEGNMRAELGDFIVQGIAGEIYPIKAEIFGRLYDLAEMPEDFVMPGDSDGKDEDEDEDEDEG